MEAVTTGGLQDLRSQRERAATLDRLRLSRSGLAVHHDQRAADRNAAIGQVHIRPAQAQQLAPAQPESRKQQPADMQPVLTDRREETPTSAAVQVCISTRRARGGRA